MKQIMQWVAVSFVAVGLAFGAAACGGGKASEGDCEKAAQNLVDISVKQALGMLGDDVPEEAKTQAEDQAKKSAEQQKTSFIESCVGNIPSEAIDCLSNAEDVDAWTACAQEHGG